MHYPAARGLSVAIVVSYHRRVSPAVDLSAILLVDGHCHPLLRDPAAVSLETFLDLFS